MKISISYKEILKNAWDITIKNKILWFYGIFASFISLEAVYEIILSQANLARTTETISQKAFTLYEGQIVLVKLIFNYLLLASQDIKFFLVFAVTCAIIIFFIWLVIISQILIIQSAALFYQKKKVDFRRLLHQSFDKFWSVFTIHIITRLITYAVFIALTIPLFYALLNQNIAGIISTNLLFIILFAVFAVLISFLAAYATIDIVLKDKSIIESIKDSWNLFKNNISLSLEVAAVLFIFKIISIIVIFCLFFVFAIPLAIIFSAAFVNNNIVGIVIGTIIIFLVFSLISLFVNSIYIIFYISAWTITYLQISKESITSKILNFIAKIIKKPSSQIDQDKVKKDIKKTAAKIIKLEQQAEQEYKKLEPIIKKEYKKYKPTVIKQAKKAKRIAREKYEEFEPIVKKESKKIAQEIIEEYKKEKPVIKKQALKALEVIEKETKKAEKKGKKQIKQIKKNITKKTAPAADKKKKDSKKTSKKSSAKKTTSKKKNKKTTASDKKRKTTPKRQVRKKAAPKKTTRKKTTRKTTPKSRAKKSRK